MKKIFYILIFPFFLVGCAEEYKPNGIIPYEDDPVEMIFIDTIAGMAGDIKLEFVNDSSRSISASYGDNNEIFYQIILVNEDMVQTKDCLEEKIMPLFDEFSKIKNNKEGFYAFASDDSLEMVTWYDENYIFLMKAQKEYLELAVLNSFFLKYNNWNSEDKRESVKVERPNASIYSIVN
jgi:hypothetical protein